MPKHKRKQCHPERSAAKPKDLRFSEIVLNARTEIEEHLGVSHAFAS
jgi:hypothetical protein